MEINFLRTLTQNLLRKSPAFKTFRGTGCGTVGIKNRYDAEEETLT